MVPEHFKVKNRKHLCILVQPQIKLNDLLKIV